MSANPLDAVFGEPEPVETDTAVAEAPEAAASAPEQPASSPERGPDGKFVAKASDTAVPVTDAPVAPAEPQTQPPLSEKEIAGFLKAMQDERDKRQAIERKAAELEARLKAQQEPAEPLPLEAQVEARLYEQNLKASRRFAEREYGKDTIATVHDWAAARCDADPIFNQQMRSSDDPYEAAYQAYQREQLLEKVKPEDLGDLDAFRAWQAAQRAASTTPETLPQTVETTPAPKSLVTASGTGAVGKPHVEVGEGQAYASTFS